MQMENSTIWLLTQSIMYHWYKLMYTRYSEHPLAKKIWAVFWAMSHDLSQSTHNAFQFYDSNMIAPHDMLQVRVFFEPLK